MKQKIAEYVYMESKWNIKRKEWIRRTQNALENVKLLYDLREAVIKLLNDYSSIVSEAKYEAIHGKGIPSMLASVTKVCDHPNLKTLSLNQTLQRLPIALAQVKAGHTSENLQSEIKQIIYSFYRKRN